MDEKILKFLKKMHVMSLAVMGEEGVYACSVFYAFDGSNLSLIFASDPATHHMKAALANPRVSANIALDTKIVGLVRGAQILGELAPCKEGGAYFRRFPYALAMKPTLYEIKINWLKYTDNALSKKLVWERDNSNLNIQI